MNTGAMICAYCGRPAAMLTLLGGMGYHPECLRAPVYTYEPMPPNGGAVPIRPLTEADVRRIVREELAKDTGGKQ